MAGRQKKYYIETSNGEVRSDDPKKVAQEAGIDLKPDLQTVYRFLRFGETPTTGKTFFKGLKTTPGNGQSGLTGENIIEITSETPQVFAVQLQDLVKKVKEPFSVAVSASDPADSNLGFIPSEFLNQIGSATQGSSAAVILSPTQLAAWLNKVKTGVYYVLMSPEFYEREFFMQKNVAVAFSDFLRTNNKDLADVFWRFMLVEIWMREFFDIEAAESDPEAEVEVKEKLDVEANAGKNLDIKVAAVTYRRYPLRTKDITREDSLEDYTAGRVQEFQKSFADLSGMQEEPWWEKPWSIFISEKIVAITQTRSFFVWEIEPGWWARKLSSKITPSSYGYGLSIPWTMELAIREVGLPRILLASVGSVLGKIFGKAGVFYMIAGPGVRAIDGPLESPVYPSFLSAKLAPNDTNKTAAKISAAVRDVLPAEVLKNFQGTVIIDANDVGRHILGKDVQEEDSVLEEIFSDNPLGQGGERTPISIVYPFSA